nr:type II toxin-antitoxin system RelE/ParE family toxin [Methylobacterium aquaticum]
MRGWLKGLDRDDRRRIGESIKLVEFGWPIGMPTCRPMREGLHEVRTDLPSNRIARVLFYIDKRQRMVLLHAFIKKSRTTPMEDLELAKANKRKHERGVP